jgi:serine/threonine protein kinase
MAPEMFGEGEEARYTVSADVWSFGMICFELITGKIPYRDECSDQFALTKLILQGVRPNLGSVSVDSRFIDTFVACTEFDRKKRPSARELVRRFSDDEPAGDVVRDGAGTPALTPGEVDVGAATALSGTGQSVTTSPRRMTDTDALAARSTDSKPSSPRRETDPGTTPAPLIVSFSPKPARNAPPRPQV